MQITQIYSALVLIDEISGWFLSHRFRELLADLRSGGGWIAD
jgi:hypothetical protein